MSNDPVKRLRAAALTAAYKGNDGNLQSVFSALDIMYVLYNDVLNCTPNNCTDLDRDYFILSKGQATLGLYCVLAQKGFISETELDTFCNIDSRLGMQADCTKFNGGIEISAGSLGHGFPMAVGVALAAKIQHSPSKIYTLVGDGEFNEGTMWEASLLAGYKKLDNLCVIIDDNDSIGSMLNMGDMCKKLETFGFKSIRINGHDHEQVKSALLSEHEGKPLAVIAKTRRGYGSRTMMNDSRWFHRAPNSEELASLLQEVVEFEKSDV